MSGRDIGNIVEIIKKDFKSSFSNKIVLLILIGIIIVPSLYALINIQACWEPYERTDDLDFAIANLDKGVDYEGNKLNIGNELVKELKKNDKFDWTFVTEDELRDGVYNGEYYAGVILPKNLSKNVISIMGDKPKQARLEYVVNVKANPVASKLSESAANSVYTTLNAKIIQIINLAAYGKLGELQKGLALGATQLYGGGSQLQAGSAQISSGASQLSSGAGQLQNGASKVQDGASQVQNGASQVQNGAQDISSGADNIKQSSSAITQGASDVEAGSAKIQSAVDPSAIPSQEAKEYVEANVELANASGELAKGSSKLADGSVKLAEGSSKLAESSGDVAKGAGDVAKGASDLAGGSVELAEGSLSLAAGSKLLSDSASQALFSAAGALSSSANSLSSITGINESRLGDYFFSPVKLDKNEVFPVPDYGSQVAPFYLVLSMWIGALVTCAMLKTGFDKQTEYSPFERYFGRLSSFVIMSILQTLVTLVGAFILGIHIVNVPLFILSALIVSVVFMIFVYSLSSVLGKAGMLIAIVLLAIQISGTGGIYPVEVMGEIFKAIHQYLPMTYAIDLMREAQLGVAWSNYLPALAILLAIGIVTLVVAVIVKEKTDKSADYLEECLEDTLLS